MHGAMLALQRYSVNYNSAGAAPPYLAQNVFTMTGVGVTVLRRDQLSPDDACYNCG